MNAEEMTFGLNTLLSVLFGAGGAIGVWFKLKGSVNLLKLRIETLETNQKIFNRRIEAIKTDIKENRDRADNSITDITAKIQEMELRIIQAIHDIKKP